MIENTIDFPSALKLIKNYDLNSFNDSSSVEKYVVDFQLRELLVGLKEDSLKSNSSDLMRTVNQSEDKPIEPEFDDLARLHFLALTRKALNVLEFGSGFSTVVLANALTILRTEFGTWAKENLRVNEPFKVYSVEEDQRYAEITRKRLGVGLAEYATVFRSSVRFHEIDHRFCTLYDTLPNISPDLIYLDGPSQFATSKTVNGFNFGEGCRMPMSADLIQIEFFLEPGTLIIVDGRTANARFLRAYLKRNWVYKHDEKADTHYFELDEKPLGKFNQRKMEFCLNRSFS